LVGGLRAGWCRKRPTASPQQSGFLKLMARDNDAAWRRAICNSSRERRLRKQRAMEVEGKLKQEAVDSVARTARLSQAQGKGQRHSVSARNLQLLL
jgi:hypothetical protein